MVAADGAESDPGSAIPALHGEVGDAVEAEGHAVGRLDRTGVVVLDRVDDDVINGLAAVEVDLDPIGIGIGRGVDPAAAITPIDAGPLVVVDRCRGEGVPRLRIGTRRRSDTTVAGQRHVGLA